MLRSSVLLVFLTLTHSAFAIALAHPEVIPDQWTQTNNDGKTVQLTWSDCSGGNMHVKNVDVKFNDGNPVHLGDTLKVVATGSLDETVTGGQYSFSAKAGFIPVAKHTDTVCGNTSFKVLGIGSVNVRGVDCSNTKPGPISIEIDLNLPGNAPSIGTDIKVQGSDSSKAGLFCVDVKAKIVGSPVTPFEDPKEPAISWELVPRVGCLQAGKCCLDCRGDCCSHEWHTTLKCGGLHRCD